MAYNNVISRTDAAGIIPVDYSNELLGQVAEASYVMRLGRRLRDMTAYQRVMPVISALATAYFVGTGADTGLVQTSEVNWTDVNLYAEDLAVLVPVPKNVLDDASIPIWSEVRPELVTALGVAIDNAVLYGTNKPTTWPDSIITDCDTASHNVSLAAADDLQRQSLLPHFLNQFHPNELGDREPMHLVLFRLYQQQVMPIPVSHYLRVNTGFHRTVGLRIKSIPQLTHIHS